MLDGVWVLVIVSTAWVMLLSVRNPSDTKNAEEERGIQSLYQIFRLNDFQ